MIELIKHVLVVDDEAEFVNTIKRHLKREGFLIESASDGKKACKKIDDSAQMKAPYDLVITDMVMPNMGAIELLEWIKKNHPDISVIVVSGFGDIDMVRKTIRRELDDYAQKPLTPKKMIKLIGNLDQKRKNSSIIAQDC